MSAMGPGTSDYIVGLIRTRRILVTTLTVCLGGGLRSQSAFLVYTLTSINIALAMLMFVSHANKAFLN